MKVAIAGAGVVGTAIARDLHANGHEVLLIEKDRAVVGSLQPTLDVTWVVADACEMSSLDAAGMSEVDVAVAVTGDDEDNLVISLLAKQEFAVPRVIARVNTPENGWLFNDSWGVDVSVSTPALLTSLVEEAVSVGSLVPLLELGGGDTYLVEVTLAVTSPVAGTALADLDAPAGRGGRRRQAQEPCPAAAGRHGVHRRRRDPSAGDEGRRERGLPATRRRLGGVRWASEDLWRPCSVP